jgi:hypothetical protein
MSLTGIEPIPALECRLILTQPCHRMTVSQTYGMTQRLLGTHRWTVTIDILDKKMEPTDIAGITDTCIVHAEQGRWTEGLQTWLG